jgi:hypothetical protein
MPFESKKQNAWGHTPEGMKALGGPAKVKEWESSTNYKGLPMYAKGSAPKDASYAKGGAVLPRTEDWKKMPDTRFGLGQRTETIKPKTDFGAFLNGVDKATSINPADQGAPANMQGPKPDNDFTKGHLSPTKSPVRVGDHKSEKPIKPRK